MERKDQILVIENTLQGIGEMIAQAKPAWPVEKKDYVESRKYLSRYSPRVAIVDLTQTDLARDLLETFSPRHPDTYWVVAGPELTPADLITFMRLGTSDFLRIPGPEEEIPCLMDRIALKLDRMKSEKGEGRNRIISFYSPKGGVGTTFLATHMARLLGASEPGRVLIADLVLQHGNVAEFLDLKADYTLLDLIQNLERMDLKLLEHSLRRHACGTFVLPCPPNPEDSECISPEKTAEMLEMMQSLFQHIVLDVGHELNEITISCLDRSDKVFVVTTPDLPSLAVTQSALRTFRKFRYPEEKIQVILNRSGIRGGIERDLILKNLDGPLALEIPDHPEAVLKAVNQGQAVWDAVRCPRLAKALEMMIPALAVPEGEALHGAA